MMASSKLSEIAKTIRSKNAGVDKITFDVIFPDRATYDRVRESGVLSRASICRIFGIDTAQITDHVAFDPALAIKFTIYRRTPSGSRATPTSSAASNTARSSTSNSKASTRTSITTSPPGRPPNACAMRSSADLPSNPGRPAMNR